LRKTVLTRILIGMILGIVVAGIISELSFRLLDDRTSRAPQVVEFVIPKGTSEKVALGESILPVEQNFVLGDTLVVRNQDIVAHSLGPLFIPPGTSASMLLNQTENLSYSCSFQPSKVFGLTVSEALTIQTRIQGILLAGVPMGFLLALYSLVAWPLEPKKPVEKP